MFVFGITTYVCHHDEHPLDYIFMMSIVMSLSHLLLLILHYYITLTSTKTKAALDFSGLIIIAWITSALIGSMITGTYFIKNKKCVPVIMLPMRADVIHAMIISPEKSRAALVLVEVRVI